MPPVFGPMSPSPMRLWSWASGRATAVVPSHRAISEHSGPLIRCSRTNGPVVARIAAIVSSSVSGTVTPLPAARPSSLTTTGWPALLGTTRSLRLARRSRSGRRRGRGCRGSPPARGRSPWRTRAGPARRSGRSRGCLVPHIRRRRRPRARPPGRGSRGPAARTPGLEALEGRSSRGRVGDMPRRSLAPGRRCR